MLVHSRELGELQAILDETRGSLSAWVVVLGPPTACRWNGRTPAPGKPLATMQGVTVVEDLEGTEARPLRRFHVRRYGHCTTRRASLQFHGGITAARGHVGNNTGRQRVVSLINTGEADSHTHEVYGCGLHDPHPRMDDSRMDGDTQATP